MTRAMLAAARLLPAALPAQASDGLSGTWTAGTGPTAGPTARVFVFKVAGETFSGMVCGPCDDLDSVFRIEDGRLFGGNGATFFVRYDGGGPRSAGRSIQGSGRGHAGDDPAHHAGAAGG